MTEAGEEEKVDVSGCTMSKQSEEISTPPHRDALGEQAAAHHGDQRRQEVPGRGARRHSHSQGRDLNAFSGWFISC